MSPRWALPGSLFTAAAAAVGASACCAGPLLLVSLGIGGAWGSRLAALEPLQPYFIAASLAFFSIAFYGIYRKSRACEVESCAVPASRRARRALFWTTATAAATLMALPLYAPLFY